MSALFWDPKLIVCYVTSASLSAAQQRVSPVFVIVKDGCMLIGLRLTDFIPLLPSGFDQLI